MFCENYPFLFRQTHHNLFHRKITHHTYRSQSNCSNWTVIYYKLFTRTHSLTKSKFLSKINRMTNSLVEQSLWGIPTLWNERGVKFCVRKFKFAFDVSFQAILQGGHKLSKWRWVTDGRGDRSIDKRKKGTYIQTESV